ncbi:MAG: pyridine nucleotide-disulfide oxidoreductase, partial [Pseudomonadota bacterium]|nr:pyridine nucleotide-disulfide oxidoreductase [Pseudomonadota bacterium]
ASIAWIDPAFTVGDFGTIWRNVPSNTKVELFLRFLLEAKSFNYQNCPVDFDINRAEQTATCRLHLMSEALQWVTVQLMCQVVAIQDTAKNLSLQNRVWKIGFSHDEIFARHVILAIGAEPKNMAFTGPGVISLHNAIDSEAIKNYLHGDDTIAVFGSSHSAILVIRNLVEANVRRIINFYRSPLLYALYLENWILFDDTGLKGPTAQWAHENIDGTLPENLERVYSSNENINHYLPQCNKVIYAVGFEKRNLPIIENMSSVNYIEQCGIIAPGLFGLGIAFPEAAENAVGLVEYRVGLWKFMDYLNRVLPIWLSYSA